MKKILFVALALSLAIGQVCFADVQINEGQEKDDAAIKFFVARNGREGTLISKDRVVIWDATSQDGVSVTTTTTSGDKLVAGITLDQIPSSTSDNTATEDLSSAVWGRVQTWGLHQNVLTQAGTTVAAAGEAVITSSLAGAVTDTRNNGSLGIAISADGTMVGIALESESAPTANGTIDIMVKAD